MLRRGAVGAAAVRRHGGDHRRPVAQHARDRWCPTRTRATTSPRCSCPTARRSSAPTRWWARSSTAIKSNPANEDAIAFTGFDFLGGGFRNSAATIFVTQKHWDERKVATPQLVGEFFMKTGHIKEALVLAFDPPPIFGLGNAGGFEFYIQNRGEGGAQRLFGGDAAVPRRGRARIPMFGQVNTLWRANVPQLYVETDREKAKSAGRAARRALQHARRDARHVLRQRLQQVRPHLAGADVGGARLPQAPGRRRRGLGALRPGRAWCRSPRSRR